MLILCQSRNVYQAKLSFRSDSKMRTFSGIQRPRDIITYFQYLTEKNKKIL